MCGARRQTGTEFVQIQGRETRFADCGKTQDNAYYWSCSSDGSMGLNQPKTVPEYSLAVA